MLKAVQQIQLGKVMGSETQALETMRLMKEAGYDAIELNGFMIKKMPPIVGILTSLAGMPVGKTGKLDWHSLMQRSGLKVTSVHEDLGSILRAPKEMAEEARSFGTDYIVITGMHHFDYSDKASVVKLAEDLNKAGKLLAEEGIRLCYHNHNCEFLRIEPDLTAYEYILENTDPAYVFFEFDSYWPAETGADPLLWMKRLGSRMELYHINDRGARPNGPSESILKSDSMELGTGNMNLTAMLDQAKANGVSAVILESHKNWIDNSPIRSFQVSGEFLKRHL